MEYQTTFDVSSLIFLCEIVLANLRERQKAVNSYPPSIHLTSEQTPQLATGTHHPSLLLKPDLSWKDSCTGQRAKALSKMYYHKKKKKRQFCCFSISINCFSKHVFPQTAISHFHIKYHQESLNTFLIFEQNALFVHFR